MAFQQAAPCSPVENENLSFYGNPLQAHVKSTLDPMNYFRTWAQLVKIPTILLKRAAAPLQGTLVRTDNSEPHSIVKMLNYSPPDPGFPVGPRSEISPVLIDFVSQQYRLGPAIASRDLGGAYNLNLLLDTPQGRFVARVFRPWMTPERLRGIQHIKFQLHQSGIPVVLPVPTIDGHTWIEYDRRLIELEPYLPHQEIKPDWQHYQKAFHQLGQLHRALAQQGDSSALPPPLVENYALPLELIQQITQTRRRIEQIPDPRAVQAIEVCAEAERCLHPIFEWWQTNTASLPRQLVHGDYGLGNLLFQQDRIIAILDFDFLAFHERIFDVAYALFWMLERLTPDLSRIPEMVDLYQQGAGNLLNDVELKSIFVEMVRIPLYWIGEALFLPDPVSAVLSHAGQVALASQLLSKK